MPQDSIHGPILFAIYTDILGISCCFMALNNIYIPKALKFISLARPLQLSSRYISNCIPSIATSIANRHFKHNMSKTECVAFPPKAVPPYLSKWHFSSPSYSSHKSRSCPWFTSHPIYPDKETSKTHLHSLTQLFLYYIGPATLISHLNYNKSPNYSPCFHSCSPTTSHSPRSS